jgi:hypothetical protein
MWNPGVELATGSLLSCLHWARVLSRQTDADAAARRVDNDAPSRDAGAAHTASNLARLDAMIGRYDGGAASSVIGERLEGAGRAPGVTAYHGDVRTLTQLDGAVAQLADRLAHPNASMQKRLNWELRTRSA